MYTLKLNFSRSRWNILLDNFILQLFYYTTIFLVGNYKQNVTFVKTFWCPCRSVDTTTRKILLSLDSLKASAVLMTSTYACSSNLLSVLFWLCLNTANLNAVCTSSDPCSKIAPRKSKYKSINILHGFLFN